MACLIEHGLMPEEDAARRALVDLDPYELRAAGLTEPLPLHHFGRALFHLNQRRGFKSNRKADSGDADDSGKIKSAVSFLRQAMQEEGAVTVGQWLASRHARGEGVRARKAGPAVSAPYEFYIDRAMIAEEFDALWESQAKHHPNTLTDEAREAIRSEIFFQRPLKPVEPGPCTLDPREPRAPLALPSVQRFRILQEVANLRYIDHDLQPHPLNDAQRKALVDALERTQRMTFGAIRRLLKLRGTYFNLESEKRKNLKGNVSSAALANAACLGDAWHEMTETEQDQLVELWHNSDRTDDALAAVLVDRYKLDETTANNVVNAKLPDGYGHLGRTAITKIGAALRAGAPSYDIAVKNAGYRHHSDLRTDEWHETLPDYRDVLVRHLAGGTNNDDDPYEQRVGRITNPTVHVGLNQLRKVGNALIARYGLPDQIALELSRDLKLGQKRRKEIESDQAKRQEENDGHRKWLEERGHAVNRDNIQRLRLWHEQGEAGSLTRKCIYTGETISQDMVLTNAVEVDHILPRKQSLDDSLANKLLCLRKANRDKGDQTPFEAFSNRPGYNWDEITARAAALPRNKRWRFAEDALARLSDNGDFLARHLNDTQYFSRVAREYLSVLIPQQAVFVLPGRLTALLRAKYGLNDSGDGKKSRDDHRHHAIDAIVVGTTTRRTLMTVQQAAGRADEQGLDRFVANLPEPWPGFVADVKARWGRIAVSHKPEHGPQGELHDAIPFGLGTDEDGKPVTVRRIPLTELTTEKKLHTVRDPVLRERLLATTNGLSGTAFKRAVAEFGAKNNVRRIRIQKPQNLIPIYRSDGDDKPFKAVKGNSNYCLEIFRDDSGKWRSDTVSTFEANAIISGMGFAAGMQRLRNPKVDLKGRPLVMRLCGDDVVAVGEGPNRQLLRVAYLRADGAIALAPVYEANVDQRTRDKTFKYTFKKASSLQSAGARRVFVDPIGRVKDPGPA